VCGVVVDSPIENHLEEMAIRLQQAFPKACFSLEEATCGKRIFCVARVIFFIVARLFGRNPTVKQVQWYSFVVVVVCVCV
jgi:hypothetical protein